MATSSPMNSSNGDGGTTMKKRSLATTAAVGLSRVTGLAREFVFAHFFGASPVLDAFIAAYRLPNLLRDLVAEGALSQAFVAVLAPLSQRDPDAADRLARKTITALGIFLAVFVFFGVWQAPRLVTFLASGFDMQMTALAATLATILIPFILPISLAALCAGMLNIRGKFFLPQSSTTLLNVTSLTLGIVLMAFMVPDYLPSLFTTAPHPQNDSERAILAMAIGTLLAGFIPLLTQGYALRQTGFHFRPIFEFRDVAMIRIVKLALPSFVGAAVVQISVIMTTTFASASPGGVSCLHYAFRLAQLPLGLFGVSVATASAPEFARLAAIDSNEALAAALRNSLRWVLFFACPAAVGLILLANPVVSLIYGHGRFSSDNVQQTTIMLQFYSLGIIGYAWSKIYQPAFLAIGDGKTPFWIALACVAANLAFNFLFMTRWHWEADSLAFATALTTTLHFILFAMLFARRVPNVWRSQLLGDVARIFLATTVMAIAVTVTSKLTTAMFDKTNIEMALLTKLAAVALPIFVAVPVYFGTARVVGCRDACK